MRPETPLQPSPEQLALIAARRADPAGSLRVLAFAGAGKTTALRLLAEADPSPALYLAYNKAAQLQARARFPAHVACRTVHSLAYRATRMFEQRHRLERRLAAREVAELLAIPALDGLRPAFWAYCAVATVRAFTHGAAREIDAGHLPPLPRGADRAGAVLAWARRLWGPMRDPAEALPLEHDAYLKLWHLRTAPACRPGRRCSTSTRRRTRTRSPWPSSRPSAGRRCGSATRGSRSTASAAASTRCG